MILPQKTATDLEAAARKECNVPSPSSREVNGKQVNVCPRCQQPCSPPPWRCLDPKCGWTAASEPGLCGCQAIFDVVVDPKDPTKAEYPVTTAEIDAAKAVPVEKRTEKEKILATVTAVAVEPEREVIR